MTINNLEVTLSIKDMIDYLGDAEGSGMRLIVSEYCTLAATRRKRPVTLFASDGRKLATFDPPAWSIS